jgi:hypothetical protein
MRRDKPIETAAEWAACVNPRLMLTFLRGRTTERKIRLFGVACCRRVWDLITSRRSHEAIEVAERWADGEVSDQVFWAASERAREAYGELNRYNRRTEGTVRKRVGDRKAINSAMNAVTYAVHWAIGMDGLGLAWSSAAWAARRLDKTTLRFQHAALADLVRCIFGNPFRGVAVDPAWRTPDVLALARAVYDQRALLSGLLDNTRLAVLADALEDAGCQDEDILTHCRMGREHARGCWVVDAVWGEEARPPVVNSSRYPPVDESRDRLLRAGWLIGGGGCSTGWVVTATNGANHFQTQGATYAEAYWRACEQAQALGMLAPPREGPGRCPSHR